MNGPRSFTRTTTVLPVLGLPTIRHVPKGNDRCAAVFPAGLNFSPEAVLCPPSSFPYHAARTVSSAVAGFSGNNRIKASHLRIKVLSTPLGRWFELAKTGHCSLGALRKPSNGVIQQLVPPH